MDEFVKNLKDRLEADLNKVDPKGSPVNGHDDRVKLIKQAIDDLNFYLKKHPFRTSSESTNFFKYIAPLFYQPYFYYSKLFELELARMLSKKEGFLLFIEKEEKVIDDFYKKFDEFCRYIYMRSTIMDELWFVPGVIPDNWILDEVALVLDKDSCLATFRLSWLKTYEEYGPLLKDVRTRIEDKSQPNEIDRPEEEIECKLSKTALVKIITALAESGKILVNGQPASQDFIKKRIEQFFNIDLSDFSELDYRSRMTKTDRSSIFTDLEIFWNNRKSRLEDRPDTKKR